ncbi:MAG: hypothetical protein V3S98_01125 [Dehalococcoidia bacterium]
MPALGVFAHHSEPTDPLLLRWLTDTIGEVTGLSPLAIVVLAGLVVLAFPLTLGFLVVRRRRG